MDVAGIEPASDIAVFTILLAAFPTSTIYFNVKQKRPACLTLAYYVPSLRYSEDRILDPRGRERVGTLLICAICVCFMVGHDPLQTINPYYTSIPFHALVRSLSFIKIGLLPGPRHRWPLRHVPRTRRTICARECALNEFCRPSNDE